MDRTSHLVLVADTTAFNSGDQAEAPYTSVSDGIRPTGRVEAHLVRQINDED